MNNQTGIFGATHEYIQTGELVMRFDIPYRKFASLDWSELTAQTDIVVYRNLDGELFSMHEDDWDDAFRPLPDVDPAEVLRSIHEHLRGTEVRLPQPPSALENVLEALACLQAAVAQLAEEE